MAYGSTRGGTAGLAHMLADAFAFRNIRTEVRRASDVGELTGVDAVVLGGAVGAKLFEVLDHGDSSWLLALVFVPAAALLGGFLAQRWKKAFLVWATAFAGAAMVLTGIGRIDTDPTAQLRRPDDVLGGTALAVLWVALALVGRSVQARRLD